MANHIHLYQEYEEEQVIGELTEEKNLTKDKRMGPKLFGKHTLPS